jgi:hypothetical protein
MPRQISRRKGRDPNDLNRTMARSVRTVKRSWPPVALFYASWACRTGDHARYDGWLKWRQSSANML